MSSPTRGADARLLCFATSSPREMTRVLADLAGKLAGLGVACGQGLGMTGPLDTALAVFAEAPALAA